MIIDNLIISLMNKTIDTVELKNKLMVSFFKLLSKFIHLYYESIREWEEYPSESDINDELKLTTYMKKIKVAIDIVLKKSMSANHQSIGRVLDFTKQIIEAPNVKSDMTKLNLLTNNTIILLQFLSAKTEEENNQVLFQYFSTIIKNFKSAYHNTYASLYEIISNNLSFYNKTPAFFHYESFFITEDEYLKSLIPQIEIEINKLNDSFSEDITGLFALNTIDYSSDLDLLYIINVLYELNDFLKYKSTYSKEEYEQYKLKIQQKLKEDRENKTKEYEKEKEKNKDKDKANKLKPINQ